MKRNSMVVAVISLFVFVASVSAQENVLKVGDKLPVPRWQWVDVENSVRNGNGSFGLGDRCGIQEGGFVSILELDQEKGEAKVEYKIAGTQYGTHCPSGVRFTLSLDELSTIASRTEVVRNILEGKSEIQKSGQLSVGQTHPVPAWQWVDVLNLKPIEQKFSNGTSVLVGFKSDHQDTCGIEEGGNVIILGFTDEGSSVLVKYKAPGQPMGTPCPSGVIFMISKVSLVQFAANAEPIEKARAKLKMTVEGILDGSAPGTELGSIKFSDERIVASWQWVDVLNLEPVTQQFSNGEDELRGFKRGRSDTCGIEAGGTLKVIGFDNNARHVLVEYTAPRRPLGTPCPSGVIFFIESAALEKLEIR